MQPPHRRHELNLVWDILHSVAVFMAGIDSITSKLPSQQIPFHVLITFLMKQEMTIEEVKKVIICLPRIEETMFQIPENSTMLHSCSRLLD